MPGSISESLSGGQRPEPSPRRNRTVVRWLLPALAPLLVAVGLWLLRAELARFSYADLVRYLRSFPTWRLLLALALTAASYVTLTGYDALALRHLRRDLPYRRIALAGFIGYAFGNSISPLVLGMPLRFRLYTAWGVPAAEVLHVLALTMLGFWLGLLSLCGVSFTLFPQALPEELRLPFVTDQPLGIACLLLIGAYLAVSFLPRPSLRLWRWELPLPGAGWSLVQIVISSLDWILAASVLFVALPTASGLGFPGFLGLFLLAQIVGLSSQAPGGLGVFDAAMVLLLSPALPATQVIGSLVIYRAIYYFLPLTLAALLLGGLEIYQRRGRLGEMVGLVGRWAPAVVPRVMSFLVFVGGALLLLSGATPGLGSRLGWLHSFLPLSVIEISHFLGSLVGVLLLLLARGLQRRIDAAFVLTLSLLGLGIVVSLLKGLDWEEASILALMLAALAPCRREFYRSSALSRERFTPPWIVAIALVLSVVAWLGVFAHEHVEYSGELWWHFSLRADAPRSLRATVGALVAVLVFAVARLFRAAQPESSAPTPSDLEAAEVLVRASRRSSAHLALLGDKSLLFNGPRTAFIMYATEGRSWISMGEPVGPEEDAAELGWRFQSLSDRHGGWPVFYQVGQERLGRYVEMGLTLMKLGEEARVPLQGFTLDGPSRSEMRQALRRATRSGALFEVLPPTAVPPLLPEIREISDAWLREKQGVEKGFSLGFFDPDYLSRCPLALVRKQGRPVAFANLWPGGDRDELSVDLMRYHPSSAPHGVMDFLFTSLMTWGAAEGYRWFNLGMAPLAGLHERENGPLWQRLGAFIFRHGEYFYNFEGLRRFKDKFAPVWEPRYLASPAGLALPRVLKDLIVLIGGSRQVG